MSYKTPPSLTSKHLTLMTEDTPLQPRKDTALGKGILPATPPPQVSRHGGKECGPGRGWGGPAPVHQKAFTGPRCTHQLPRVEGVLLAEDQQAHGAFHLGASQQGHHLFLGLAGYVHSIHLKPETVRA